MAFRIPNFNIPCDVWDAAAGPYPPAGAPRLHAQVCQLAIDRQVGVFTTVRAPRFASLIRFPRRTDIRSPISPAGADIIEAPMGSGNWFAVQEVFDVARDFDNEYREALCMPVQINQPMT